jgi:putative transposase
VIDLASRRLLGWSMGERHDATLVVDALQMAVAARGRRRMAGTIFHHDRGSEYTSGAFRAACRRLGVTQSAGRTGSCLDNAVAESFFATLKVELIHRAALHPGASQGRVVLYSGAHGLVPGHLPTMELGARARVDPAPSSR